MYLGHVLAPTLGISKLTWQNSHYRKQNIFVDMFWHFFDIFLTGYITFLTCFDTFLTVLTFFWPTDRQMDRRTDQSILYDMFWHFLTCFDTFWHFFDRQTHIQNLDVVTPTRSLKIPFIFNFLDAKTYASNLFQYNSFCKFSDKSESSTIGHTNCLIIKYFTKPAIILLAQFSIC